MSREENLIQVQEEKAIISGYVGFPHLDNPTLFHMVPFLISLN